MSPSTPEPCMLTTEHYQSLSLEERIVLVITRWATTLKTVGRVTFPDATRAEHHLCDATVPKWAGMTAEFHLRPHAYAADVRMLEVVRTLNGESVEVALYATASMVEILDTICYALRTIELRSHVSRNDIPFALQQETTPFVLPGGLDYFPSDDSLIAQKQEIAALEASARGEEIAQAIGSTPSSTKTKTKTRNRPGPYGRVAKKGR